MRDATPEMYGAARGEAPHDEPGREAAGSGGRYAFDGPGITTIAIAMSSRQVSRHFGRAEEIMLVAVEDGDIRDREVLPVPVHECGVLPVILRDKGVVSLVTGSIGERAMELLEEEGIRVYSGAQGSVEDALGCLLSGSLVSRDAVCGEGTGACAAGAAKARAHDEEERIDRREGDPA